MWRSLAVACILAAGLTAAAAQARDPWDPHTKIRATDQADAKATLLTRDDLGSGWSGGARAPTSFKAPTCPAQRPNDGDLTITGHAESLFSNGNGGIQIDADIEVFPTAAQAKARFVRFLQPKLFTCLEYDLAKSLGGGVGMTFLKPTRLDFPKLAERTGAFRVPIAVKSGSQTVTVDADFIYLGVGRSLIYVNIIAPSVQEAQLPGFERRLAKLLVKRASG
jgi:hypothetical protein